MKLTEKQKKEKVELAIKIILHSTSKDVSITSASKKYGKNKRFVYDVNRRWIKKNNKGVPNDLVNKFKDIFTPKKIKK